MPEPTWDRLSRAFGELLEHPVDTRASWLAACDPDLRDELAALLAAQDDADPGSLEGELDRRAGERLGAWRVVRAIGRGGMGDVFLASRADEQYTGAAAIKVGRAGGADDRFVAERQILATLDHPNIARLLDGGVTGDGRPYLVMEYVSGGVPIVEHCAARGLGLAERLVLFGVLCDAVAHAHARLVVHRDLKSDNVLVTPDGQPHLLDFGVAKALDPASVGLVGRDTTALAPLTLACAAPEQLRGDPIGTATDVYGLGVLLYELLAGRPPHDLHELPVVEAVRRVCESPAPPAGLGRELDAVLAQALRLDPRERYPSVAALAADVRRYLDGQPVLAADGGLAYRVRKYVVRNRVAVTAGTAVVASLVVGLLATGWQAREAARERDRAVAERQAAERVSDLVVSLFEGADPTLTGGQALSARDVVDRGEPRVLDGLGADPIVRARLVGVLGEVRRNLGDFQRARDLRVDAVAAERANGPGPELARALAKLAEAHNDVGAYRDAEDAAREARDVWADLEGPDSDAARLATAEIAAIQVQIPEEQAEAEATWQSLLSAHAGPPDLILAGAAFGLGELLLKRGDGAGAAARFEEAAALCEQVTGPRSLERAMSLDAQGVALGRVGGRVARQIELFEEGLSIRRELLGEHNPGLAASIGNLATALLTAGRYGEALPRLQEAVELYEAGLGHDHDSTALGLSNLGVCRLEAGDVAGAEAAVREALAIRVRLHGPDGATNPTVYAVLARVLLRAGALDEALQHAESALRWLPPAAAVDERPRFLAVRGSVRLARGDAAGADADLVEALRQLDERFPDGHPAAGQALVTAAQASLALGQTAEAERRIRRALDQLEAQEVEGHWHVAEARRVLGEVLVAAGRPGEGLRELEASVAGLEASVGAGHYATVAAREALGSAR